MTRYRSPRARDGQTLELAAVVLAILGIAVVLTLLLSGGGAPSPSQSAAGAGSISATGGSGLALPPAWATPAALDLAIVNVPGLPYPSPTAAPDSVEAAQAWAHAEMLRLYGRRGEREWACLYGAIRYESRWRPDAVNPRSGSCGLIQAKPCSKMADLIPDWREQPTAQMRWAIYGYLIPRYGSPCRGREYQLDRGWL